MPESSSDVHEENESEYLTSMRREATMEPFINVEAMDTSSTNQVEGERDKDLNKNEAILSPNHSSEEGNHLQSESKQMIGDHMEKEKLDRIDISEDYQLPIVTEVTNADQVS
ncbi:MAG: hypothetical protein Q8877_03570, partial [Sweet potato little leaf phytoplasma]|nr:hypothetical protein [Sweet potato little leaf phytoplasma]